MNYRILLYYKYIRLADHEEFAARHLEFCGRLGLRGRIIIAPEGINGTVSGSVRQTDAYVEALRSDPRFGDLVFKIDEAEGHVFDKLFVRAKPELVTFRLDEDVDPAALTGLHLSPGQFHEAMQSGDVIIIDARADYEYDLGHFRNAIRPDIRTFREFPEWIRGRLAGQEHGKILTYCTGGVRCEKLTGFLLKEGFRDVAQLEGGIAAYARHPETRGRMFEGKCYVFDKRIAVEVNSEDPVVVSRCLHCGRLCDVYINCANIHCHLRHFSCQQCQALHERSCSEKCRRINNP